ncbi:hypothetical protein [Halorussus litoreus]|uniref:hypothetical protein n=1 Tax=Halorussus litoreus TaxID=1710536 RepID=UPI000E26F61B|nr:hypothetical protein [Halorussus litoreus]
MEFDELDGRSGLGVFDPIENARFELYTPDPVELEPATTEKFYFPVDVAVGFHARAVEIPKLVSTVVRNHDGEMLADATASTVQTFGAGTYLIELQSTPMKLYVLVDGPLEVHPGETSVTVEFGARRRALVGARSFHERPIGTVTVTDDVEDAMAAISLFGSALKTTSCERSFPTLRGHPPRVERGDSFDVSGDIDEPGTGVEIVVPPDREHVYRIASLAYYLGARLVAGSEPRIVADDFEYSLDGPGGFEKTVNRVLKQVFFLDCLTRTEGFYPVDLHEREQVEPEVDLDFERLYGQPLTEQLPRYLSVPFEVLEPHVLDWHLTTDIVPVAEHVPALPYFANELSLLRTPTDPEPKSVEPTLEAIDEFTRAAVAAGDFTRSASGDSTRSATGNFTRSTSGDWNSDDEMFQVDPADTIEHAWVGDGYPVNANKVTLDALHREADRTPPDESAIDVHVVCNDPRMAEENAVSEFYGLRDFVNYDVSIHNETTVTELADLLEAPADFLHYVGHVDEKGFNCSDGYLDAESLDSVGVEAFLLNACRSYDQGRTLVRKGSRGGVVTLAEVIHSAATQVGCALARLLNSGFTLRSALSIARKETMVPIEYVTIGHGGLALCDNDNGIPMSYRISKNENKHSLTPYAYPSPSYSLGSMSKSRLGNAETHYLASGALRPVQLTKQEIISFVETDEDIVPVQIGDELYWGNDLSALL